MNNPLPPADPAPDDDVSSRLAAMLQQAYRTETADESLARLEQTWQELRHDARRRVVWHRALVAAAAVMVVATLGTALLSQGDSTEGETIRRPTVGRTPKPQPPPSQGPPTMQGPLPMHRVAQRQENPSIGLAPTLAQQALFTVRSREKHSKRYDLAALLTPHVGTSPDAAASSIIVKSGYTSKDLRLSIERDWASLPLECQPLAVALLARVGGHESAATLRRMGRAEPLRAAAVRGLLASSDYADVATALEIAPAGEVARLILTDPAWDVDQRPLGAYLALVFQARTREAALESLASMPAPPIDALMGSLDSEQKPQRIAAAFALGKLGGTEVTARLIQLVTRGDRRHAEAWLAVVQCRGPLADEFLALAARDPLLLGHYNAALIRQQQFVP